METLLECTRQNRMHFFNLQFNQDIWSNEKRDA